MEKIKEVFKNRNGIYGYRRITIEINRTVKKHYNPKRIRRLMNEMGLKSHIRRSNGYSTKTSYVNIEENILNREFSAEKPNEKWVTDITHMTYGFGNKAYLSAIKDLYDGSIVAYQVIRNVAYQVIRNNDNPLVMKTLETAIEAYPNAKPLIHSDRGS